MVKRVDSSSAVICKALDRILRCVLCVLCALLWPAQRENLDKNTFGSSTFGFSWTVNLYALWILCTYSILWSNYAGMILSLLTTQLNLTAQIIVSKYKTNTKMNPPKGWERHVFYYIVYEKALYSFNFLALQGQLLQLQHLSLWINYLRSNTSNFCYISNPKIFGAMPKTLTQWRHCSQERFLMLRTFGLFFVTV